MVHVLLILIALHLEDRRLYGCDFINQRAYILRIAVVSVVPLQSRSELDLELYVLLLLVTVVGLGLDQEDVEAVGDSLELLLEFEGFIVSDLAKRY